MSELLRDIRYGLRLFRKSLGFTGISLAALALGIGATTAIFSLLYSVLLAPLPYEHADDLMMVWSHEKGERQGTSPAAYLEWKKQATVFESLNAWIGTGFTIVTPEWTESVEAQRTAQGFVDNMLGERPQLGRNFVEEDFVAGNDHVVILMNQFWRDKFNADPSVIGRKLRMNGEAYTVVGVTMPGPADKGDAKLSVPLTFKPEEIVREQKYLMVMGQLKKGATQEAANAEMQVLARRQAESFPQTDGQTTVTVEPLKNDFLPKNTRMGLWLMMGAVGFVLLIACVNIANLLLAWGTSRQKEIAVRAAQGATGKRIFRQFLIESLTLALIGGGLGVALSIGILSGLMNLMPRNQMGIPYEANPHLNWAVLAFTMGATMLSGVLFGCAPAWYASRQNVSDMLKEGGKSSSGLGHQRLRRSLVVAEFALALVLVGGAGLIIRSFYNLTQADLGVRTDHVLTFQVQFQEPRTNMTTAHVLALNKPLLERIATVPGVEHVAAAPALPAAGSGRLPFSIVGQAYSDDVNKLPVASFVPVTPGYYDTYGIRLVSGRFLDGRDLEGSQRVAMVSESFAKQYLQGVEPVGQRVRAPQLFPEKAQPLGPPVEWLIVGVFHDVQYDAHPNEGSVEIDVPFAQNPWPNTTIAVRTQADPEHVARSIAAAIRSVNPEYPMTNIRTMDQVVRNSRMSDRFALVVFSSFAGLALLLAVVGIYGVMTFSVAQRTHEMGIRIALGAGDGQVLRQVLGEGMRAALLGMLIGIPGVYFVGRLLQSVLYQVKGSDPQAMIGVAVVLLGAALVACYAPARRATRIDPMRALRQE